jgi:K+-transporting ATPase A subunit
MQRRYLSNIDLFDFQGFSSVDVRKVMLVEYKNELIGIGDNTPFRNLLCGIVMLLARCLPIIGHVVIAGYLAEKKYIPESSGTLPTDNLTFGVILFSMIMIIWALASIAEYFTM